METKRAEGKRSMLWVMFAFGAVMCWGMYGPALHRGQVALGSPLRALLCVGVAYFLIGVLVPLMALSAQGGLGGFNMTGTLWAGIGGALGALGAVCIIWAFRNGGLPNYVMPLVFGGAPVINVIVSMALHPPKNPPNPLLWVGFAMAVAGAALVLRYKPQ
jgi:drug/metabolite transporter (DMT)-like permease